MSFYLSHPWRGEEVLGDPQREVARGEGLGQNPRSRRPAPVCKRQIRASGWLKFYFLDAVFGGVAWPYLII